MKIKKKKIEKKAVINDDGKYKTDSNSMIQVFDLKKTYHMGEFEVHALDGITMKGPNPGLTDIMRRSDVRMPCTMPMIMPK